MLMPVIEHGFVIVTYSKEPKYHTIDAVCRTREEALRIIKRLNMESGSNAIPVLYLVDFDWPGKEFKRSRDPHSKIDDGDELCYVLSSIFEDRIVPYRIFASMEDAEKAIKEENLPKDEVSIDLAHIIVS